MIACIRALVDMRLVDLLSISFQNLSGSEARPACETTQKSSGRKKNLRQEEKKSSDLLGWSLSLSLNIYAHYRPDFGTHSFLKSKEM